MCDGSSREPIVIRRVTLIVRAWKWCKSFLFGVDVKVFLSPLLLKFSFFYMLMRWTIVFTLRPFVILRLKRVSDDSYQIDSRWSLEMYNQIKTQNKEKGYSKNMKYWPDEWFGGRTCREQDQGMERMGGGGRASRRWLAELNSKRQAWKRIGHAVAVGPARCSPRPTSHAGSGGLGTWPSLGSRSRRSTTFRPSLF